MLRDTYYIRYLLREMKRNPDYRLTRKFVSIIRWHPARYADAVALFTFIESDLNLFPHQHAEILWAFRYLSKVPPEIIQHCKSLVLNANAYFYLRSAAPLLLSRTLLEKEYLDKCRAAFHAGDDTNVRIALAILLMQSTGNVAAPSLHALVFHPNEKIRKVAKLLREVRYDVIEAKKRMKFLFGTKNDWVLCDYMGVLFSMSLSDRADILKQLIKYADEASKNSPRLDLRLTLAAIATKASARLSHILKQTAAEKSNSHEGISK